MNWKNKLSKIEKTLGFRKKINWEDSINIIEKLLQENPNNVELNIRIIYILHNILVEEYCSDFEFQILTVLLKKQFNVSKLKFSNNAEYLFFIGIIINISEWYFGLDDRVKDIEQTTSFQMLKKAHEIEPKNSIYEWAINFIRNKKQALILSCQICNDKQQLNWLKTKGFAGYYVKRSIVSCCKNG